MFLVIKDVNYAALYFIQNYVASILSKNGQYFSSWGYFQCSVILKKENSLPSIYVKTCNKVICGIL